MQTSKLSVVIVALAMIGLGGCAQAVFTQKVRGSISGRRFSGDTLKVLDVLLNGFQLGAIYQYQSGFPRTLGNVYCAGNGDDLRTLPSRFGWLRDDGRNNLDFSLLKKFRLRERTELQFRAEVSKALNHVIFNLPDLNPRSAAFGTGSGQVNLPRYYQLGLRLTF